MAKTKTPAVPAQSFHYVNAADAEKLTAGITALAHRLNKLGKKAVVRGIYTYPQQVRNNYTTVHCAIVEEV